MAYNQVAMSKKQASKKVKISKEHMIADKTLVFSLVFGNVT